MPIKPFIILIAVVLGWALIPPTLCHAIYAIRRRISGKSPKMGIPGFVIRRWYTAYAFLSVAFGWSTVFLFYPLIKALHYSMTDKSLTAGSSADWVGFTNYASIFRDPLWWGAVWVTCKYILFTLPYSLFVCLFIASLIVTLSSRWQTFFKTALYIPAVTSVAVSTTIMKYIFFPDGFANLILGRLSIVLQNLINTLSALLSHIGIHFNAVVPAPHLTWFGDPRLALPTIIVMSWLAVNAMAVLIYCAALGGIPKDYYEAAELDGASPAQKFFHITWPLAKPSTVYVLITGLIGGFQVFAPALLITAGGPLNTTNFVNYVIYRTFYYDNLFGRACAMSVALMVIIVTVSIINYRYVASDVEY
jgi:multiple sugar transport system permease protein